MVQNDREDGSKSFLNNDLEIIPLPTYLAFNVTLYLALSQLGTNNTSKYFHQSNVLQS